MGKFCARGTIREIRRVEKKNSAESKGYQYPGGMETSTNRCRRGHFQGRVWNYDDEAIFKGGAERQGKKDEVKRRCVLLTKE